MFFGIDLITLIQTIGYIGLFAVIFAESGLFFGFFFPGDSLLFTAGFLASQGHLNVLVLLPLLVVAAVGGDNAGYWTGKKLGGWLLSRPESFFFKRSRLAKAQAFYAKHGGKTLILARFIPAVRTFVPIAAGLADMPYKSFFSYNVIGGLLWTVGMIMGGYFLGSLIPNVDRYILPIIALIIIISVIPAIVGVLRANKPSGEGAS
jgi:membrane-associated protein